MSLDPKARELVLKARIYRALALVFALAGLVMFLILFMQNVEGSFFSSLTNPFVVTILLFPFLPAAVLSFKASRLEKEYINKYLHSKK